MSTKKSQGKSIKLDGELLLIAVEIKHLIHDGFTLEEALDLYPLKVLDRIAIKIWLGE